MSKEKILYCVLNWGLGHASRSIPIITDLLMNNNEVTIASDGIAGQLLKNSFPDLEYIELPGYNILYKHSSIVLNLGLQTPKFFNTIALEKQKISNWLSGNKVDKIFSDSRFGCYHKDIPSTIITHQLKLVHPNPIFSLLGTLVNKRLIHKFDDCWVPDNYGKNSLAGKMSHGVKLNIPTRFIGTKSRFSKIRINPDAEYKSLSILSGPEPQRSKLEKGLIETLRSISGQHAIISGVEKMERKIENIHILGLLDERRIKEYIENTEHIISRSGYSSIMDYEAMNRQAILIPTPGQPEQTYLAKFMRKKGKHRFTSQNNLNLRKMIY